MHTLVSSLEENRIYSWHIYISQSKEIVSYWSFITSDWKHTFFDVTPQLLNFHFNSVTLSCPPGSHHLHKTLRHFPPAQHPSAQVSLRHSRGCIPAELTVLLSHGMAREEDVPPTNNTTLMSRGLHLRKRFQDPVEKTKKVQRLMAPVWLTDNICRSLCSALLVTLCVGENYKLPTSLSQGQGWWVWREMGSYSLDL